MSAQTSQPAPDTTQQPLQVAPIQHDSTTSARGNVMFTNWVKNHPQAGAVEKDVMRRVFGAESQPGLPQQNQPQPPKDIVQPLPPVQMGPAAPDTQKAAMQRAVGSGY